MTARAPTDRLARRRHAGSRHAGRRPGLGGLRSRLILAFMVVALTAGMAGMILALAVWAVTLAPLITDRRVSDLTSMADLSGALACTTLGLLTYIVVFAQLGAREVLKPVGRLAEAARRIAEGDLGVRLDAHGADEVTDLVDTFNEMAAALQENVGELRRLEAQARRFAANVSHELRTPLAAMMAVTDLLEEKTGRAEVAAPGADAAEAGVDVAAPGADVAAAARLVPQETRKLNRLVADLIEISRFEAGTATLVADPVRLAAVVHDCLRVRDRTDRVLVEVPKDLVVRADPRRLDVIVANLVDNALRHGAPPVVVRASAGYPGRPDWVSITVSDCGPGLSPEVLPHVFERFYKSDAARGRSEGSGLGLAIAWENARLHGGVIDAANRPEGGAIFTVGLPASRLG